MDETKDVLDAKDINTGVSMATLGSISILSASFLKTTDVIRYNKDNLLDPVLYYIIGGFLLLCSSGSYLLYRYLNNPRPHFLYFIFQLTLGLGLGLFLLSTILTLLSYINII